MATPDTIKTAIDRAVKAMRLRPAIAKVTHRNSAHVTDGLGCRCTEGDWSLDLDLPTAVGGDHTAPSPGVFVRSALTACIAMGVKMTACRFEVPVDAVDVNLEVVADDRGDFGLDDVPPGYEHFALDIAVTSSADPAAVEKIVADSLACSPLMALHKEPQKVVVTVSVTVGVAAVE